MPVKFRLKEYVPGGVYHIYNRGLDEKWLLNQHEEGDFFKLLLKRYLWEGTENSREGFKSEKPYITKHKIEMCLKDKVKLLAYCLMPDHFHLLVKQEERDGIELFMKRLMTGYAMFYNRNRKRKGPLFEGVYKGVLVKDDDQVVWLSRMIHLNPLSTAVRRFGPVETVTGPMPEEYMYSSYGVYTGKIKEEWVDTLEVLKIFESNFKDRWKDYKSFVNDSRLRPGENCGGLNFGEPA